MALRAFEAYLDHDADDRKGHYALAPPGACLKSLANDRAQAGIEPHRRIRKERIATHACVSPCGAGPIHSQAE